MIFKNILFVMTFAFVFPSHCFTGLDFLRKQNNAKKAAAAKIGAGLMLALPGCIDNRSIPLTVSQILSGILGGGFILAGGYQMVVEALVEEDEKSSVYPDTHHFDNFSRKIITDQQFLQGAAFAAAGVLFNMANETNYISDTSIACSAIGVALMGFSVARQFNKDYMPHIKTYFNK